MRKVVKSTPKSEVIALNKINNESYVGIKWSSGVKSWITEVNEKDFRGAVIGDQYLAGCWKISSKKEYVEHAMKQTGTEVYVFENKDELLTFLLSK
jgi:hypothetical protein